jgi:dTDP-4-dehydrorhamnose reductase
MTLLVFGTTGQLAVELRRREPDARYLGRAEAELMHPDACADRIREIAPSAVINAAAWTAVDAAEDNREAAHQVNAKAPGAMARACKALDIPMVHVSTDYVFDGAGTAPRAPSDPTGPLGVYGATKLAGEIEIASAGGTYAILRTSWVFSAHGQNFVKSMLRLAKTHDRLSIVADQTGGPTPAADLAAACLKAFQVLMSDNSATGTYHFAGQPAVSWAGFARDVFRQSGLEIDVRDIPSSDYPTPAPRPLNSRLDCSATEAVFGIKQPDWRVGLRDVLAELAAKGTSDDNA